MKDMNLVGQIKTNKLEGKVNLYDGGSGGGYIPSPATRERLGLIKVGDNMDITQDGVLTVKVTNDVEQDNTLPVTSAGVHVVVGNIESLLSII